MHVLHVRIGTSVFKGSITVVEQAKDSSLTVERASSFVLTALIRAKSCRILLGASRLHPCFLLVENHHKNLSGVCKHHQLTKEPPAPEQ